MKKVEKKHWMLKAGGIFAAVLMVTGCLDSDIADQSFAFRINHIAIDPDPPVTNVHPAHTHTHGTVFAASDGGGIFKSVDGGMSWQNVSAGLTDFQINWIAFDPSPPANILPGAFRYIYAGTENQGVFRSTDGGAVWSKINNLSATRISSIVIDPNTCASAPACDHIYVGARDGEGIFRSINKGGTWGGFNGGDMVGPQDISRLGIYDNELVPPSILFAGTETGDMFKYNAAVDSDWVVMDKPAPLILEEIYSIDAFSPIDILVGVSGLPPQREIVRSTTPTGGWVKITPSQDTDSRLVFLDPTALVLYADAEGMAKSPGPGASGTWTTILGDVLPGEPGTKDVFWAAVDYHHYDSAQPDLFLRKKALYFSTFSNLLWKYSDDITEGTWEWRALDISN